MRSGEKDAKRKNKKEKTPIQGLSERRFGCIRKASLSEGSPTLSLAEPPISLFPTLAADARVAHKDALGIDLALDLKEALVVVAPKGVLPVVFEK